MAEQKEKLFSEFEPVSTEAWMAKITADLKGVPFEKKLVWKTGEGFNANPFYRLEDLEGLKTTTSLPGEFPFVRGTKKDNDWLVRQNIEVGDCKEANAKALDVLMKGVTSLGFIIKGLVGFGDPLVYTPLLSVALPNSTITPGMLPVSLVLNARVVWQNRDHFSPRLVLPIAAFVMLGIIPGTLLLRYGSPTVLKLLLGLVIIAMGVEMLTRKPGTGRPSALLRSVMSFLSGVTAGLFGIDLLFLAYLERVTQRREEFRSNVCFVFIFESVFRMILYLWNGMFNTQNLLLSLIALPASLLGMWVGALLDKRVSDRLSHRFIIYVFILGGISSSIYALVQLI